MDLAEIKNSRKIYDVIWVYNLCATDVDEQTWQKAESLLNSLIDTIIKNKDTVKEEQVRIFFTEAVEKLENLLNSSPLDENGIYEYGGLNSFFADIMKSLGFPVTYGEFCLISDFVYGEDFGEAQ